MGSEDSMENGIELIGRLERMVGMDGVRLREVRVGPDLWEAIMAGDSHPELARMTRQAWVGHVCVRPDWPADAQHITRTLDRAGG